MTQAGEQGRRFPDVGEGLRADVASFVVQVGTCGYRAARSDPAVMRAGDTTVAVAAADAVDRRVRSALQRDTLELGRAARPDDKPGMCRLCIHQLREHVLIATRRQVREPAAAARTYQEEHIQHARAALCGEVDDRRHLVDIHVGHREVQLERQALAPAFLDTRHRPKPRTFVAAEAIMFVGVQRVDADACTEQACALQ